MLSAVMLNVVMLNAVMLKVVAPLASINQPFAGTGISNIFSLKLMLK
jgi:hypothetical protein